MFRRQSPLSINNNNKNNNDVDDIPLPPLPPPVGGKCCDSCIAPHLPVLTNHKCFECGRCLHLLCTAMEVDDPSVSLGNDSICHDCYGTTKEVQALISSGKISWVTKLFCCCIVYFYYVLL